MVCYEPAYVTFAAVALAVIFFALGVFIGPNIRKPRR
jgi:hypothetical protein